MPNNLLLDVSTRYSAITLEWNTLKFKGEPYNIEIKLSDRQLAQLKVLFGQI